ncbi:aminotransferase class I/II-fold pyridoxal phosphate-dependent enzyme [Desulfocurvus sp. DL9XJH121]
MSSKNAWYEHLSRRRLDLESRARLRTVPAVDRGADAHLMVGGRRLVNLASNNYLGLAGEAALRRGAEAAMADCGASSGASRLVTGNYAAYDALDRAVARFKGAEDSLTVGSGYAANLCVMTALAGRGVTVFSDRLNHASIVDGILLSRAEHVRYRHCDMEHLSAMLQRHADAPRKILVTDTVFSMDGDLAPLEDLARLARDHGALLVLDEAHATGVLGKGRGLAHELGLEREADAVVGTFSKALGSYGAFITGRGEVLDAVRNFGRAFIFSTSLPPAVVGANLAALEIVAADPSRGERVLALAAGLREYLAGLGFDTGDSATQIIPVVLGDNESALAAHRLLLEHGVYVPAIRPPSVPEGTARLRLSLRADFSDADMDAVRRAFAALAGARR